MAGFVFNIGAERLLLGSTVWHTSPIKARLVLTSAGAPSVDADSMTGIGDTTSGFSTIDVTGAVAPAKDDATNRINFVADDLAYLTVPAIGACARVVFFHYVTDDAGSFPIFCVQIAEIIPIGGGIAVPMVLGGWFYSLQQTP